MLKKCICLVLLLVTLSSLFCVTVSAADRAFYFDLDPSQNGGKAYSSVNVKDDDDQYAHVYTENHSIGTDDYFYYRVTCSQSTASPASDFTRVRPGNASYVGIHYYDGYAWAGANRYLEGDTDKYNVYAMGHWWS